MINKTDTKRAVPLVLTAALHTVAYFPVIHIGIFVKIILRRAKIGILICNSRARLYIRAVCHNPPR
mgnify:CR=1 FL=1